MSKETGGQDFPKQQWEYDGQNNVLHYQEDGMTLRDYFAANAMQGDMSFDPLSPDATDEQLQRCATHYYRIADAMIKARGE